MAVGPLAVPRPSVVNPPVPPMVEQPQWQEDIASDGDSEELPFRHGPSLATTNSERRDSATSSTSKMLKRSNSKLLKRSTSVHFKVEDISDLYDMLRKHHIEVISRIDRLEATYLVAGRSEPGKRPSFRRSSSGLSGALGLTREESGQGPSTPARSGETIDSRNKVASDTSSQDADRTATVSSTESSSVVTPRVWHSIEQAMKMEGVTPCTSAMSWRRLVSHPLFQKFISLALFLNLITIGIESVLAKSGDNVSFAVGCEVVFLAIYSLELTATLLAYGYTAFPDPKLFLEGLIVGSGFLEMVARESLRVWTDSSMTSRCFRVARYLRAVRLFLSVRPLRGLVEEVMSSIPLLLWTLATMALLIYMFALLGMELLTPDMSDDPTYVEIYQSHFADFGSLCLTLLQALTLDDIADIYTPVIVAAPWSALYFISFMVLSSFFFMSLVVAILVEARQLTATSTREAQKNSVRVRVKESLPELEALLCTLDTSQSGVLGLHDLLQAPEWMQVKIKTLTEIFGLSDILEIFQILDYENNGRVSIRELLDGMTRSVNDNTSLELLRVLRICQDVHVLLNKAPKPVAEEEQ